MRLNFWKKEAEISSQDDFSRPIVIEQEQETVPVVIEHQEPPEETIYSKISRWTVIVGVFLVPLFFLPVTTNVIDINKQILLLIVSGIGIVAWLLHIVSSGWISWRKNIVDYAVFGVLIAAVLSSVFSLSKFKSLFGADVSLSASLMTILSLSLIYLLIVNNFTDRVSKLRQLLGLSLTISLLYGMLQLFGVYIIRLPFSMAKSFNTVGSINAFGLLAAVTLPFLSKLKTDLKWLSKIHLDKISVVLSLVILFVINWWLLWTIAIVGMVGLIVFESISGEKFKIFKILLPMMIIVIGVFFMIVKLNFGNLRSGFPVEVAPSYGLSWQVAEAALKKSPLFGYGPENFSIAFDRYGVRSISNTVLAGSRFFDGTSEFLNLMVQEGILGILAFGFLLWSVAMLFWKFIKNYKEDYDADSIKEDAGLLASFLALLTAMFFYPFNMTIMSMFYIFLAISVATVWDKERRFFNIEQKTSLSLVSSLGFIAGLILILVGGYFGGTQYIANIKYANALTQKDNQESASMLVQAINLNSNDDRYYVSASQVALNLLSDAINKPGKVTAAENQSKIQNYTNTAISLARKATEVAPQEANNWSNLGLIYQSLLNIVGGVDSLSEQAYLKAAELRPGDANYYNQIGTLYLSKYELLRSLAPQTQGDNLKALTSEANRDILKSEENLIKAVNISNNFGLAIYNLGAVYDREGKLNDAIAQLEKIVPANSNQAGLNFELGLLYYRAGSKDNAFNQLQKAVLIAPDYSNARWYLALINEERGNIDEAINQLERISSLDVNKDNTIVQQKLASLKAGKIQIPPGRVLDQKPLK